MALNVAWSRDGAQAWVPGYTARRPTPWTPPQADPHGLPTLRRLLRPLPRLVLLGRRQRCPRRARARRTHRAPDAPPALHARHIVRLTPLRGTARRDRCVGRLHHLRTTPQHLPRRPGGRCAVPEGTRAPRHHLMLQPCACLSSVSASLTAKPPPFSLFSCVTTPSLTSRE